MQDIQNSLLMLIYLNDKYGEIFVYGNACPALLRADLNVPWNGSHKSNIVFLNWVTKGRYTLDKTSNCQHGQSLHFVITSYLTVPGT